MSSVRPCWIVSESDGGLVVGKRKIIGRCPPSSIQRACPIFVGPNSTQSECSENTKRRFCSHKAFSSGSRRNNRTRHRRKRGCTTSKTLRKYTADSEPCQGHEQRVCASDSTCSVAHPTSLHSSRCSVVVRRDPRPLAQDPRRWAPCSLWCCCNRR